MPRTAPAGDRMQVVVQSSGLDGTAAKLYQFAGKFTEKPPTCRDEEVQETDVTLTGGAQPVDVASDTPGDVWFVLRAGNLATDCGATDSVTRVMFSPKVQLRWPDGQDEQVRVGVFSYLVGVPYTPPTSFKGWPATVTWYGPFQTIPEAAAATCSAEEAGPVTKATVKGWTSASVKLTDPGVYRVGWKVTATPWSEETTSTCDDETLTVGVR